MTKDEAARLYRLITALRGDKAPAAGGRDIARMYANLLSGVSFDEAEEALTAILAESHEQWKGWIEPGDIISKVLQRRGLAFDAPTLWLQAIKWIEMGDELYQWRYCRGRDDQRPEPILPDLPERVKDLVRSYRINTSNMYDPFIMNALKKDLRDICPSVRADAVDAVVPQLALAAARQKELSVPVVREVTENGEEPRLPDIDKYTEMEINPF